MNRCSGSLFKYYLDLGLLLFKKNLPLFEKAPRYILNCDNILNCDYCIHRYGPTSECAGLIALEWRAGGQQPHIETY